VVGGSSPSARGKIEVYAAAVAALIPRTAPLQEALRTAGETDADWAATRRSLVNRRAANMRLFAADLRSTGELRDDLTVEEVRGRGVVDQRRRVLAAAGPAGLDATRGTRLCWWTCGAGTLLA